MNNKMFFFGTSFSCVFIDCELQHRWYFFVFLKQINEFNFYFSHVRYIILYSIGHCKQLQRASDHEPPSFRVSATMST